MSKNKFKSQASSSRATIGSGFGAFSSSAPSSTLSYVTNPQQLSEISDANVVVSFKNLTKKDSTTKSKGLEDLRTYVRAHPYELDGGVEEPILDAWVDMYPRIAIDDSRKVREVSHSLQFELLKSARKRMERHIPKIVGSWLAGTYDRDRAVSRAATDGISSFLDNEKKVALFWKKCQVQIIAYALEAINETPQTLSDERTISAEDAQAKYFRVIGSSLSLVLNLLSKLDTEEILKFQDEYDKFLSHNKKLWAFAACDDSFVRRTTSQLLVICLEKQTATIEADLVQVSHAFITEGLRSSQSSSAFQLLVALNKLTSRYDQVWTSEYKSKKSPLSRIRIFVEKGSQGGPPEYWKALSSLIRSLPSGVLPADSESAVDFLKAFRNGITCREEPRSNASEAWTAYFQAVQVVSSHFSDDTGLPALFESSVYPVFRQYMHPTVENSQWNIKATTGPLVTAYNVCTSVKDLDVSFADEWNRLADGLIERVNTSLPEKSKDYHKSQNAVIAESHRWFTFSAAIQGHHDADGSMLVEPSAKIVKSALMVQHNREGKPYSAAATVETTLRLTPKLLEKSPGLLEDVKTSLSTDTPALATSPSSKYLISSLFLLQSLPNQYQSFQTVWNDTMTQLLALPSGPAQISALVALVSSESISELCRQNTDLQRLFSSSAAKAVHEEENSQAWPLFEAAINFSLLAERTEGQLIDQLIGGLDDQVNPGRVTSSLKGLEYIVKMKPGLLKANNKIHVALVTKLLALTEITDADIPPRASALRNTLEKAGQTNGATEVRVSPIVHVIQQNLETASPQSLSIETLLQQAKSLLESPTSNSTLKSLLPNAAIWSQALQPALDAAPDYTLAVMRPFAGSVYLTAGTGESPARYTRDVNGFSVPLRMAMFTARIMQTFPDTSEQHLDLETLYLLGMTAQLVQDQIDLQEDEKLAAFLGIDVISEVQDFIPVAKAQLYRLVSRATNWLDETDTTSNDIRSLISRLITDSASATLKAFNAARILSDFLQRLVNEHGWNNARGESWLQKLDILKSSTTNTLGASAILIGLQDVLGASKFVNTLCNRVVSDIAGAKATSEITLPLLVLMNAIFSVYEDGDLPVAQNRLIFAVKQILSWTDDLPSTNPKLASEACYALHRLLPAIKDIFGSYWESALSFIISIWDSNVPKLTNEHLPMVGMSLKLYSILRTLQEPNDDLIESLSLLSHQLSHGLIKLLQLGRDNDNVPLLFVDNMLERELSRIPLSDIDDFSEFYPVVANDHKVVQSAAYDVLHRALPEQQKQLSVDVLLENRDAQLPEELLSLLLDAPTLSNFPDDILSTFPPSIRGYLLSWLLVFDSYSTASYKVRSDYSNILKSDNYLSPLLDFMFDVLGHSAGYPLSLSSFSDDKIRSYTLMTSSDPEEAEQDLHHLLVHLYYLILKYTPSLAKAYYSDLKSKQTRIAVESWTSRFFSPLIIADTMTDVLTWAEDQEVNDAENEKELTVKVSRKVREVSAGYEVDDTFMQIVIKLPEAYPLDGVKVEGVQRVAVSAQKWTGWLMNTQGAITFSNGSITDALLIFRKNVHGALKGKAECAICYSLISANKKMPDKGCHTCKNLFHADCLYKWFSSSNQSTCPLCRNPFNYGVRVR